MHCAIGAHWSNGALHLSFGCLSTCPTDKHLSPLLLRNFVSPWHTPVISASSSAFPLSRPPFPTLTFLLPCIKHGDGLVRAARWQLSSGCKRKMPPPQPLACLLGRTRRRLKKQADQATSSTVTAAVEAVERWHRHTARQPGEELSAKRATERANALRLPLE